MANQEEIIEKDEQTEEHDGLPQNPIDLKNFEIGIREDKFSVFEILRRYQKGQIILDESFQRNLVWGLEQMSRFIESIILDMPIPPLYFNQTVDNKYIVVDGRQRLSTLICFLGKMKEGDKFDDPNFHLKSLKTLEFLNGKTYQDLVEYKDIGLQARIEDKNFSIFIIKPSVKMPIIYDIFDRINTNGTKLNKQEVRNALLGKKAAQILKKLAENESFLKATDHSISDKRMKAQETVLRILCFLMFDHYKEYEGNMSEFLEKGMKNLDQMPEEQIKIFEQKFERVMRWSYEFFGKESFRLKSEKGRNVINLAVMDSICHFFAQNTDHFLTQNQEQILTNYPKLFHNYDYLDAISQATSGKTRVHTRFQLTQQILTEK